MQVFVYSIPPPIRSYFFIILNTVTVFSILTELFWALIKTSFV